MSIISRIKAKRAISKLKEEKLYEAAASETGSGKIRQGLWAKALIEVQGDHSAAKASSVTLVCDIIGTSCTGNGKKMKKVLCGLVMALTISTNLLANDKTILVNVEVDWGTENIQEIYEILQSHVDTTRSEEGCEEFTFSVDINNPNILKATEVWTNMQALENHFKTENYKNFNSIMEKYPPKNITVNTYEIKKVLHPLD
jgi:quinol monooxygenase YgiN